jgi:rare lipoprotein A
VLQSPTKAEASYVRKREYPKVPGYLGKFDTVDIAHEAAEERFDVREEDSLRAGTADEELETAAIGDALVPRPQLAVSPSLAREFVMLRLPPRPVNRGIRLVQGPRLVSRDSVVARQSSSDTDATFDFGSGLQRYLPTEQGPARNN